MKLEAFLAAREAERTLAYASGYNNGDAATNGEYACLDLLVPQTEVFVDVGANAGLFTTRALAAGAKDVLAFEPNPAHGAALSTLLAGRGRLEAVALGGAEGSAVLHVHPVHHATASLTDRPRMNPSFRAELQKVEVPVRRLDAYAGALAGRRLFIKIDAEGYEAPILRGAAQVLRGAPAAAVLFEHSFAWLETGESLLSAFGLLESMGYAVFRVLPLGLEAVRFFTNDMERAQYCNYLAVRGLDLGPDIPLASPYGETRLHPFV